MRSLIFGALNRAFIGYQWLQSRRFRRRLPYQPDAMSLTELADYHGTDKGDRCTFAHGYTHVYEDWLEPLRARNNMRLLEIGVDQGAQLQAWAMHRYGPHVPDHLSTARLAGASLRMWADYFPNAEIHGMDIVDRTDISLPRTWVFQCDQGDATALDHLMMETGGGYDLILDDGSHASLHQQVSFFSLFEHLKPGGQYIIEDLSIHPPFEKTHLQDIDGLQPTQQMCAQFNTTGALTSPVVTEEKRQQVQSLISTCEMRMDVGAGLCLFMRKA